MKKLGWRGAWQKSKVIYALVILFMAAFWGLVFTAEEFFSVEVVPALFSVRGGLVITALIGFVYIAMFFDEKKKIRCSCGTIIDSRNRFCLQCGEKVPDELRKK